MIIKYIFATLMCFGLSAMEPATKYKTGELGNSAYKIFDDVSRPTAFNPTILKGKYEMRIEGDKPLENIKNQRILNLDFKGVTVEEFYNSTQKIPISISNERLHKGRKDGRKQVMDVSRYPDSTGTFLDMHFGVGKEGQSCCGSGVMISPSHVLTAGHNVYDSNKEEWANFIKVSPGANESKATFGSSQVVSAFIPKAYFKGDSNSDLAVLVLKEPLGNYTGYASIAAYNNKEDYEDKKFYISGYPGDKTYGQLWEMKGKIKGVTEKVLRYEIDTYPGQSGSPVWRKAQPPIVVGIHVRGEKSWNEGTRITIEKMDWIIACLGFGGSDGGDSYKGGLCYNGYGDSDNYKMSEPYSIEHPIPVSAKGNEEMYRRFLKGELIYRPKGIDKTEGEIRLRIADLKNPLEGRFDLSKCGDAGNYLSINTGYRKGKKEENANKVEIWLTPRFLVEKEQSGSAKHLQGIMGEWNKEISVGVLHTWGGWDITYGFEYNITTSNDLMSKKNLYEIYEKSDGVWSMFGVHSVERGGLLSCFVHELK